MSLHGGCNKEMKSDKFADAIVSLQEYCEPWAAGGAGDNDLTSAIRIVLAELKRLGGRVDRLEALLKECSDMREARIDLEFTRRLDKVLRE